MSMDVQGGVGLAQQPGDGHDEVDVLSQRTRASSDQFGAKFLQHRFDPSSDTTPHSLAGSLAGQAFRPDRPRMDAGCKVWRSPGP
jgi:hypothetical protein